MSGDSTYAPKSPDLSSFCSPGPTPPTEPSQHLFSQQPQSNFSRVQRPSSTYFSASQQAHAAHQHGQHQHQEELARQPQALAQPRPTSYPNTSKSTGLGGVGVGYLSPSGVQPEYFPSRAPPAQPAPGYPAQELQHQQIYPDSSQYRYGPSHHLAAQAAPVHPPQQAPYGYPASTGPLGPSAGADPNMPPRRAAAAAAAAAFQQQQQEEQLQDHLQQQQQQQQQQQLLLQQLQQQTPPQPPTTAAGPSTSSAMIEPSPVKTKFPTARIKRIMQADEEVGKVAQQTPIAVGKALELFMVALVTKSAEVARQKNSKRVSAQMLKQVVEGDDQWDFLRDIVGKVEVGEEKGKGAGEKGRVKAESEGSEEEGGGAGGAGAVKKKRGGGGRRRSKGSEVGRGDVME
ncbi:DNA polymerase epsilon subunit C [Madurella mycetomatis]|uniref:NCT transcriptional regulatory complex subunit A n=1 Tax=Madurella mycetomatis TaxID=100816 RepID=A0A175W4V7_9PEZI|nr:DNA polymerase epsilon subunit C [Madurella mycetomatis]